MRDWVLSSVQHVPRRARWSYRGRRRSKRSWCRRSAPIFEEAWKGLGVLALFWFLRREFDGVVDGVIYATFIGIGFAAVENVLYYSEATRKGNDVFALTVLMRGVLSPWIHPLFTAMTGLGVGVARETTNPTLKWGAPIIGYVLAVMLHAVWNGSAVLTNGILTLVLFPLWLMFVGAFMVLMIVLVRRRGRIVRDHLIDEIAMGNLTHAEVDLVASAFGRYNARKIYGPQGDEFVRVAARLALSKWHASRAIASSTATLSFEFVGPLRQRIAELKRGRT